MKAARDIILKRLRAARPWIPEPEPEAFATPPPPSPTGDLVEIFTAAARAVDARVDVFEDRNEALRDLEGRVRGHSLLRWQAGSLPAGVAQAVDQAASLLFQGGEADRLSAAIGLTACHGAVAATGSLVLIAGPGCSREVSLVADRHLALLDPGQILADLPAVMGGLAGRAHVNLVTGPSRTADIEMTLTKGVHGPRELEILVAPWRSNGGAS